MNAQVHHRGRKVLGLLKYCFGPGRVEEHTNPHLIAAWDGAGDLTTLAPRILADGEADPSLLAELLEQPVRAGNNAPKLTVWHMSLRAAPGDRILTDTEWAAAAAEVMDAVKLAPHGDPNAVRWIAVRHADNHIHLVATLVRQDGKTAWAWDDAIHARQRCRELEEHFGLQRMGPMDGTTPRPPTSAELRKAQREGRKNPARVDLRRAVRSAAAASGSEAEFFARLADNGLLVGLRHSDLDPDEVTGYKVADPTNTTHGGQPIWFSGGNLARDLTLPKLRQRWADTPPAEAPVRISVAARVQALTTAGEAIREAAAAITSLADENPQAALALAQAAADTMTALATAVEGTRGGPLTRAAELLDQATREPHGHVVKPTRPAGTLRALSRLVHLMGRMSGTEDTAAMLELLLDLAALGDSVAALRQAQDRLHQVQAARAAAALLRGAGVVGGRLGPVDPDLSGSQAVGAGPVQPPVDGDEQQRGASR